MKAKVLVFGLLVFLGFMCGGQTIIDPHTFPIETTPNNTNFEFYSRATGVNRRATFTAVRDGMLPFFGTQLGSPPPATGNTTLKGQFVEVVGGDIYYIDMTGKAVKINREPSVVVETYFPTSGTTVNISFTPLPDVSKIKVERNGVKYVLGTTGCTSCNVTVTSNTLTFVRAFTSGEQVTITI